MDGEEYHREIIHMRGSYQARRIPDRFGTNTAIRGKGALESASQLPQSPMRLRLVALRQTGPAGPPPTDVILS